MKSHTFFALLLLLVLGVGFWYAVPITQAQLEIKEAVDDVIITLPEDFYASRPAMPPKSLTLGFDKDGGIVGLPEGFTERDLLKNIIYVCNPKAYESASKGPSPPTGKDGK